MTGYQTTRRGQISTAVARALVAALASVAVLAGACQRGGPDAAPAEPTSPASVPSNPEPPGGSPAPGAPEAAPAPEPAHSGDAHPGPTRSDGPRLDEAQVVEALASVVRPVEVQVDGTVVHLWVGPRSLTKHAAAACAVAAEVLEGYEVVATDAAGRTSTCTAP